MPMNAMMSGLVAKFIGSYANLGDAKYFLEQIKDQMMEEGVDEILVRRTVFREISALKKRTERQYALDSNQARSLFSEEKRERKLDIVTEDFYDITREIKSLEKLFKLKF